MANSRLSILATPFVAPLEPALVLALVVLLTPVRPAELNGGVELGDELALDLGDGADVEAGPAELEELRLDWPMMPPAMFAGVVLFVVFAAAAT